MNLFLVLADFRKSGKILVCSKGYKVNTALGSTPLNIGDRPSPRAFLFGGMIG